MKKSLKFVMLLSINFTLNFAAPAAYAMVDQTSQAYTQGYEDGFIYTAQQTGKGCKNRLSQAAISRLDESIKNNFQPQGDGDVMGDGGSAGNVNVQSKSDYNAGKMRGMGDVLAVHGDGDTDLCTNGD